MMMRKYQMNCIRTLINAEENIEAARQRSIDMREYYMYSNTCSKSDMTILNCTNLGQLFLFLT